MSYQAVVEELLAGVARGDAASHERLFQLVYQELKGIARANLRRAGNGLTINPTTLVHESWLRFSRLDKDAIENAAHFYNIVAQAMRHILYDLADRKSSVKHGGELVRTELSERLEAEDKPLEELLAVHSALDRLQACDAELGTVVEWHYFAGLSVGEIAQLRKISERTVKRHLAMGRAFLHETLNGAAGVIAAQ
jgi:RNA polymerase sigma factor (TIGR02999 family)